MATQDLSKDFHVLLNSLAPADLVKVREYIDAKLTPQHLRQANLQLSPLLQLPKDILEYILIFVVTLDNHVLVNRNHQQLHEPGILHTCYSLRREALRLYYGRNVFELQRSKREELLQRWIRAKVGKSRQHLQEVHLGPPLRCSNEEAQREAAKLEVLCGLKSGRIWTLSEDDFENDFTWWVNSSGDTKKVDSCPSRPALLDDAAEGADSAASSLEQWLDQVARSESEEGDAVDDEDEEQSSEGPCVLCCGEQTRKRCPEHTCPVVEFVPTPKSISSESQ